MSNVADLSFLFNLLDLHSTFGAERDSHKHSGVDESHALFRVPAVWHSVTYQCKEDVKLLDMK